MLLNEAYIKEKNKTGFLLKIFNVSVQTEVRPLREHKHSMFEIVIIKSGSGVYSTTAGDFSMRSGDVFVFSSNEQHCIIEVKEDIALMNIQFEPRFFWGSAYESFSDEGLFFSHNPDFCNRLPRGDNNTEHIKTLILAIEKEFSAHKKEYKMSVRSLLTEILITLIRKFDYADNRKNNNPSNIKAVKRAINYVHKHLTEPISLGQIASYAGMSKNYFSAVFRDTFGETLWDYVNEKRIELAMKTLDQSPESTMLEIALSSGFNSTANFNKAFKKQTGTTPKDYKSFGKTVLY